MKTNGLFGLCVKQMKFTRTQGTRTVVRRDASVRLLFGQIILISISSISSCFNIFVLNNDQLITGCFLSSNPLNGNTLERPVHAIYISHQNGLIKFTGRLRTKNVLERLHKYYMRYWEVPVHFVYFPQEHVYTTYTCIYLFCTLYSSHGDSRTTQIKIRRSLQGTSETAATALDVNKPRKNADDNKIAGTYSSGQPIRHSLNT